MMTYYNRQGKRIPYDQWIELLEDHTYKIIQQDHVGQYFVSTVWLGLNHNPIRQVPHLIFETMIFRKEGDNEFFDYQERYSTEKEARAGHVKTVELCKEKVSEEQ